MNLISPLLQEHRLIEKMMNLIEIEIRKTDEQNLLHTASVDVAADFMRTYVDLTHHGKEEYVLFRNLALKNLSPEQTRIMNELIEEHKYARSTIGKLMEAKEGYLHGDDMSQEINCLKELARFYHHHIEKEEEQLFYPLLDWFTEQEQDKIINEFGEFDKNIIHWKYRKAATVLEERLSGH